MNLFVCSGNFVADPELRQIPETNNQVVTFRLAVSGREYLKGDQKVRETAFLDFEAWDSGAETIAKYFRKGDFIIIDRAVARLDQWEDKTTRQKRSRVKFRVEHFEFPRQPRAEKSSTTRDANF